MFLLRLINLLFANLLLLFLSKLADFPTEMKKNAEEKYVWPWVGVVANVPTEVNEITGRREGRSGSTLRDELTEKGFNPTRVKPIWSYAGHSGFALVEFNKDFQGFENAIKFERSFKLDRHGKKDWKNNGNKNILRLCFLTSKFHSLSCFKILSFIDI